jgi:hypothetical protein
MPYVPRPHLRHLVDPVNQADRQGIRPEVGVRQEQADLQRTAGQEQEQEQAEQEKEQADCKGWPATG